jgi:hypothetical protein
MNLCWFLCLIFDCFKYIFFSSDWFFTVESYFYHYKPTENILIQHLVHIVLLHYKIQSCHNIAEILLKLVLNTNKKINQYRIQYNVHGIAVVSYSTLSNLNLSIWGHLFSFFFCWSYCYTCYSSNVPIWGHFFTMPKMFSPYGMEHFVKSSDLSCSLWNRYI